MKDSKFIELVNLYIDHQITPEDAALLEAEIQQKPERRRVYREYCQMQKACVTLAENFRSDASATEKGVEMPDSRRGMAVMTYAMGIAAAAACVALVVVNRPAPSRIVDSPPIASSAEASVATSETIAAVQEPTRAEASERTVLHSAFPGVSREGSADSEVVATASHVPLDWMEQVRFERVSTENLWFETSPALQANDLTLSSGRTYEGQVETTAFIFAK